MSVHRTINRKFKVFVSIFFLIVTTLIGGNAFGKTVLTLGTTSATKSINPFVEYSAAYYAVFYMTYDTLRIPTSNGETANNMATDFVRSEDGLTYTIKIRTDASFQDGKPVTIEDVVFSYNYIIKNELGAFTQYTAPVKEVKVVNASTMKMSLSKPINRSWLNHNTFLWVPIVPKHIWSDISKEAAVGKLTVDKVIGSGPYYISEFEPDHFMRLTLTKDGKERFNPAFDEVIVKQYANDSAMLQDFKAGNINLIPGVPEKSIPMLEKMKGVEIKTLPYYWLDEVIFNSWENAYAEGRKKHPHPALKDLKIREALDWVLNEELAAKIAHGKIGKAGNHYLPPGYAEYCNTDLPKRGYDIEKAKRILAEAGYKDTDGDGVLETKDGMALEFDVWIPTSKPHEVDVATIWAREANKVGIKLVVSAMDGDTLWGKISPKGNFDIALWNWGGYADPDYLLSVLTSANAVENGWSDSGFTNKEFDELYEKQKVAKNFEERKQIIWKMQEILHREMPYLVINHWGDVGAINTDKLDGDMSKIDTPDGLGGIGFILSLKPKK